MAMGQSAWYFSPHSQVARVDIGGGEVVWTGPASLEEVFPALKHLGVYPDRLLHIHDNHVGKITTAQQTAANEAVFDIGVRLYRDGLRDDISRRVRLDIATGQVLEYPATFGQLFKSEGWREYRIFDKTAWKILNTITRKFIIEHDWADPVFALPDGQRIGLPPDATTMGIDRGKLYLKTPESQWSYLVFDLDNLTTDGETKGMSGGIDAPTGFDPMFTMLTDPDTWRERRPAPEFDRDLLKAVNFAAHEIGTGDEVLLNVMFAESGLRTTAYHPAGRYGLLQMTAEQLASAGWEESPADYLDAGPGQLPVIATHLKNLSIPPDIDEAGLWLSYLLDRAFSADDIEAPLAAPDGPRPDLWETHAIADMDADGVLRPMDLHQYIRVVRHDPRVEEVRHRMSRLSAIIPEWFNLTEVNEGSDMGIRPSATSLGLLVDLIEVRNEPGFDHEQVVSIDPAPRSLQRLVDPVEVKINRQG